MVQRVQRLLDRGLAIPLVHLVQVDVVRAETAQAGLAAGDDVLPREAASFGPSPMGMRTLVATSTSSRRPRSTSPTISSAWPPE